MGIQSEMCASFLFTSRDPRVCDSSGKSALHYAAQLKSSIKEQVIQVLVDLMPLSGMHNQIHDVQKLMCWSRRFRIVNVM